MLDGGSLHKGCPPQPVACPFCDQAKETINHILLSCVFTRQIWSLILQSFVLAAVAPTATAWHFSTRWGNTNRSSPKEKRKGLNSIIIIVAWEVWKHKNSCVFFMGLKQTCLGSSKPLGMSAVFGRGIETRKFPGDIVDHSILGSGPLVVLGQVFFFCLWHVCCLLAS